MSPQVRNSDYFIVGLLIIISVSPLTGGPVRLAGYLLLLLALILRFPQQKADATPVIFIVIGFLFAVIQDIFWPSPSPLQVLGTHVLFFSGLALGWVVARRIPVSRIEKALAFWAFAFAFCSLVGVAIYTFTPSIVHALPSYGYQGTTHHTIGISNLLVYPDGLVVNRNSGIASEPGLFQMVLNLGVAAMLRFPKENFDALWFFKLGVIGFAIFTTRSTMGLAVFCFLILIGALHSKRLIFGLALSIFLTWEAIWLEATYQQENKLMGSEAFAGRFIPMQTIFSEFITQPLGVGIARYNAQYIEMNWGSFDSFSQVLIRYGFPLALVLSFLLLRSLFETPLSVIVIALTLASQPIWATPLVAYFYFCRRNTSEIRKDQPIAKYQVRSSL